MNSSDADGIDVDDEGMPEEMGVSEAELLATITPRPPEPGCERHDFQRVASMRPAGGDGQSLIAMDTGPSCYPGYFNISFFTDRPSPLASFDININEAGRFATMLERSEAGLPSGVNIRTCAGMKDDGRTRRVASLLMEPAQLKTNWTFFAPPRKAYGVEDDDEPEMAEMLHCSISNFDLKRCAALIRNTLKNPEILKDAELAGVFDVYEGPDGVTYSERDELEDVPPVVKKRRRPLVPESHAESIQQIKTDLVVKDENRGEREVLGAKEVAFDLPAGSQMHFPGGARYAGSRPAVMPARRVRLNIDPDHPRLVIEAQHRVSASVTRPVVFSTELKAYHLVRLAKVRMDSSAKWGVSLKENAGGLEIPNQTKFEICEVLTHLWAARDMGQTRRASEESAKHQLGLFTPRADPGFKAAREAIKRVPFEEALENAQNDGLMASDEGPKQHAFVGARR